MRVERKETFLGAENEWPDELRDSVLAFTRRLENEFDNLITVMQNPWTISTDTEAILFHVDGSRLTITNADGSLQEITVDFGQDTATA